MRKFLLGVGIFALPLMGIAVLIAGSAPPDDITIDGCATKKAPVQFSHKAHFELATCGECHHTQEGLTADSGEEVEKCVDCHKTPEKEDTPVCTSMSPSKNPYHINCVKCHKAAVKEDPETKAPTKCNDCHPKD